MDWSKNQGANILNTLINQTIKSHNQVNSISYKISSHPQKLNLSLLFNISIKDKKKNIISEEAFVQYCLLNKFRHNQIDILKSHFGYRKKIDDDFDQGTNTITIQQFLKVIQNKSHENFKENSKNKLNDISQLINVYFTTIIHQKQKTSKFIQLLSDHYKQLISYFILNHYQTSKQYTLTLQQIKDFMYDSQSFTRVNFNIIKIELFDNQNQMILIDSKEKKQYQKNRSISPLSAKSVRSTKNKSNSILKKSSLLNNNGIQNKEELKKNKSHFYENQHKALKLDEKLCKHAQSKIITKQEQLLQQSGQKNQKNNSSIHNNSNQLSEYISKEISFQKENQNSFEKLCNLSQTIQAEKFGLSSNFNYKRKFYLDQAHLLQAQIDRQIQKFSQKHEKSQYNKNNTKIDNKKQNYEQYQSDNNNQTLLIKQTSQQHQPSTIKGTKQSFNVNSILDQIDIIQKQLQQKRKRNDQKRKVIQVQQAKRIRLVGQIMSKKKTVESPSSNLKMNINMNYDDTPIINKNNNEIYSTSRFQVHQQKSLKNESMIKNHNDQFQHQNQYKHDTINNLNQINNNSTNINNQKKVNFDENIKSRYDSNDTISNNKTNNNINNSNKHYYYNNNKKIQIRRQDMKNPSIAYYLAQPQLNSQSNVDSYSAYNRSSKSNNQINNQSKNQLKLSRFKQQKQKQIQINNSSNSNIFKSNKSTVRGQNHINTIRPQNRNQTIINNLNQYQNRSRNNINHNQSNNNIQIHNNNIHILSNQNINTLKSQEFQRRYNYSQSKNKYQPQIEKTKKQREIQRLEQLNKSIKASSRKTIPKQIQLLSKEQQQQNKYHQRNQRSSCKDQHQHQIYDQNVNEINLPQQRYDPESYYKYNRSTQKKINQSNTYHSQNNKNYRQEYQNKQLQDNSIKHTKHFQQWQDSRVLNYTPLSNISNKFQSQIQSIKRSHAQMMSNFETELSRNKWNYLADKQEYTSQKKRQELLKRASSEAKLKIQQIERRALQKVYSRQNFGSLSKRTYDLKNLQRKMEETMLKYRTKDKIQRKNFNYPRPQRQDHFLRLY